MFGQSYGLLSSNELSALRFLITINLPFEGWDGTYIFSIMCQMPTEFVIQKIVNCNSESQTLNAILCKRHDPTRVFNAIIQLSEANGNEVNIVSSNENFSDVTGHFVPCYLPDGKSFSDLSVKEY